MEEFMKGSIKKYTAVDLKNKFGKKFPLIDEKGWELLAKQTNNNDVWINTTYQVNISREVPGIAHLSIKRRDKKPIHNWRDLQEIKNMLIGEENEAVEIYPAESRRVDTANQYHLWVFVDSILRVPFGFSARIVLDGTGEIEDDGCCQEPLK